MTTEGQHIAHEIGDREPQGAARPLDAPQTIEHGGSWLWTALYSFLLAMPMFALELSSDIGFGRGLCNPRPVGSLGTIFDAGGSPICQIEFARAFLTWSMLAAMALPLVVMVQKLYRRLRDVGGASHQQGGEQTPPSMLRFGLSLVLYLAMTPVAVYVLYWQVMIITAAFTLGYPAGRECLCIGADFGNYSDMSNTYNIPACCTLYIDQALHVAAAYSLLGVAGIILLRFAHRKVSIRRDQRSRYNL